MGRGLDGYLISVHWLCVVLKARGEVPSRSVSGGYGEGETPLPIPNRAVKPLSADGTWPARAWESRSPPVIKIRPRHDGGVVADGRAALVSPAEGSAQGWHEQDRMAVREVTLRQQPTDGMSENHGLMRDVRRFLRENPQVLVLLVICLILGLGTFLIVLFGIANSGPNAHLTGEPSGSIAVGHGMISIGAW